MKKILVIAALALVSFANAQKGTILVAGNVGYSSQKDYISASDIAAGTTTANEKLSTFNFSPKVGYQFSDKMTVGIEASINSSKATNGSSEDKANTLKVGGFFRYAMPLAGVFSAYADLGVGMQSVKLSDNTPGSTDTKLNGMYVGVTPAIGVDLKKGFCLNFSIGGLGYDSLKGDWTGAKTGSNFGFTFGKQASVGISKNF